VKKIAFGTLAQQICLNLNVTANATSSSTSSPTSSSTAVPFQGGASNLKLANGAVVLVGVAFIMGVL